MVYFGSLGEPALRAGSLRSHSPPEVPVNTVFNGDYMFGNPPPMPTTPFAILTAAFAVLFLGSAFAYWRRARLAGGNAVLRRFIRRASSVGMWLTGIGLFLALMRYLQFPYLSMRIFMYVLFLVIIAAVAYFVYDRSERYPQEVWRLREREVHRRYRPAARPRPAPQKVRPKVRGKQRRR